MKMNVTVDCTPEEARRFLGLPDVSRANEVYVDALTNAMKGGSFDQMQDMIKQIAPMGEFGIRLFQQFLDSSGAMTSAAMGGGSRDKPRKSD